MKKLPIWLAYRFNCHVSYTERTIKRLGSQLGDLHPQARFPT